MYRDSPQELRKMDYCNGVQDFINYTISNPRNISGCDIRCPCKMCKNKKLFNTDVVTMHFLHKKKIHGGIPMLVCTQRTICSSRDYVRKDG
jgi:hypothetical protein